MNLYSPPQVGNAYVSQRGAMPGAGGVIYRGVSHFFTQFLDSQHFLFSSSGICRHFRMLHRREIFFAGLHNSVVRTEDPLYGYLSSYVVGYQLARLLLWRINQFLVRMTKAIGRIFRRYFVCTIPGVRFISVVQGTTYSTVGRNIVFLKRVQVRRHYFLMVRQRSLRLHYSTPVRETFFTRGLAFRGARKQTARSRMRLKLYPFVISSILGRYKGDKFDLYGVEVLVGCGCSPLLLKRDYRFIRYYVMNYGFQE